MIGNKHSLDIYLGRNNIAKLFLIEDQMHWHYEDSWRHKGFAISPHLPLRENIPSINVQRYLRNLLPEGEALEELVSSLHLSKNNTFGIIRELGSDISGAIQLLLSSQHPSQEPLFRPLSDSELEERLNKAQYMNLIIWDEKPRLSVAGIQAKINVLVNEQGELGFGDGSLCSTHILKFEKTYSMHLVLNEYISMNLARLCGLNVANAALKRFGKHSALLVERFDRKNFTNSIKRRHVIDGCQALNLPPEYKYERNFGSGRDVRHIRDGASLQKLFAFSDLCINPAETRQKMLDWLLFNILICNYDAHGKNISFFIGEKGILLAPFYDLVNIKMYPEVEQEFAMALGDEFDGTTVNAYQLADFADACKLPRSLVTRQLKVLIEKLVLALEALSLPSMNSEEKDYWAEYKKTVMERCIHLKTQSKYINAMAL